MKKLIVIACSVAILHGYSLALAQNQEVASVKYTPPKEIERADNNTKPMREAVREHETNDVEKAGSGTFDNVRTSFELRKVEKNGNISGKVGPNGEDIFLKGRNYYFLDSSGKRVKVKGSQLKYKAKHS